MKINFILPLLAATVLLTNCENSQNYHPLHEIDGTWKITRLHYVDKQTGIDSLVSPVSTFLVFDVCTKNANKMPSNCKMRYQIPEYSLPFTFQVTDNNTLGINGDRYTGPFQQEFRRTEEVLNGGYQIAQLDNNTLRLIGDKLCNVTVGQPRTCRYYMEIDAEKE